MFALARNLIAYELECSFYWYSTTESGRSKIDIERLYSYLDDFQQLAALGMSHHALGMSHHALGMSHHALGMSHHALGMSHHAAAAVVTGTNTRMTYQSSAVWIIHIS